MSGKLESIRGIHTQTQIFQSVVTTIMSTVSGLPLYGLDPETLVNAPQCSGSGGEFCFLCSHERDAEQGHGTECLYTSIVDLVNHLSSSKKEVTTIVREVQRCYNDTVRDSVVYKHPETGVDVVAPEWTKQSIMRHLLFSNQFDLFDAIVRHMLHAIVVKQNATMICPDTLEVFEDKRVAFTNTLKSLQSWEAHIGVVREGQSAKRHKSK